MPNNPNDDFLKNLARMVEDMIRNMPEKEGVRFVGYTVIAGTPGEIPHFIHMGNNPVEEIKYEVVEDEAHVFVTGELPPGSPGAAYADISPNQVTIIMGEKRAVIPLESKIDVIHSYYQVRHGVIDIILKKKKPATA
jgi:HSP20 family molecular chaperone IbpA